MNAELLKRMAKENHMSVEVLNKLLDFQTTASANDKKLAREK